MRDTFKNKKIILTGHTGFKGAWLAAWLTSIGAKVYGISLSVPDGEDSLHALLGKKAYHASYIQDIRDYDKVQKLFNDIEPDCVFHLAAQALVRPSFEDPLHSFSTNIMGTAHILEACRHLKTNPAIVCITTDKVYDNVNWVWPYRESDKLGGKDPYSASKAGAEMVSMAYMRSLYPLMGDERPHLAVMRGGNVIGGGDWAVDRIIPDAVRASMEGKALHIRNPDAVRPWQHVLDLCHGYMTIAEKLMSKAAKSYEGGWNIGSDPMSIVTVYDLAEKLKTHWQGNPLTINIDRKPSVPEAHYLTLDISKAARELCWQPGLTVNESIAFTADWYTTFLKSPEMARRLTYEQIEIYSDLRREKF
ncbi:MAG: CDP-glucose 4,6-dehydratase [Robiginitomaculum sp.]